MPQIFQIILTIIAPILLVAGLGALLSRIKAIDARSISQIVIYLASPSLAFYGTANAAIQGKELADLFLFYFLATGTITVLAWLITGWLRMSRLTRSAFILSIALTNVANYGIPLNEFAFGQRGLERAIIVGVLGGIYANTVGVFLASSGKASLRRAFGNVWKVPLPYAAVLGLSVNFGYLPAPNMVMRITGLLGNAAVPLMLIMLGMQVAQVSLRGQWGVMIGAALLRLLGGAAVGFSFSALLGLEGATRQVAIVEASMPTAVIAGILATEFNSDSQLVSSVIFLSTLLSLVTLPWIIFLLLS